MCQNLGVPLPETTGLTESDENFSTLRDHSYITINTKEGDITNDIVKLHGILYRNVGEKNNYVIHPKTIGIHINLIFNILGFKNLLINL